MRLPLFTLGLMLCATTAHAGAWTQADGEGLAIMQASYFSSGEYFDVDGSLAEQDELKKYELQPYIEYGVRDWLTLGGSTYLQRVGQSGDNNYGIADTELFARARIWQNGGRVIAVQPLVKLPSLYHDDAPPRGGSKALDMELSLLYGENMPLISDRDYLDIRAGYRQRGRGLAAQWRGDIAFGMNLTDKLQIIPAFRAIVATEIDDAAAFSEDGEQDFDLYKAELTLAYHLNDQRWLQLTVFDHIAGMQTGAGRGISLGIAERF